MLEYHTDEFFIFACCCSKSGPFDLMLAWYIAMPNYCVDWLVMKGIYPRMNPL